MEKKFFFQLFIKASPQSFEDNLLKKMLKNFIIFKFMYFFDFYNPYLPPKKFSNNFKNFQQSFLEYNGFLLFSLKTQKNPSLFYNYFAACAQSLGLHIKYFKFCSLYEGFNFSGWFFLKNAWTFSGKISSQNIYYHQQEIQKYLKNSTLENPSMDQIMFELNQKILAWQKFYNCSMQFSQICSRMNHFLFCQIWLWLKKRHQNKSSKWLYHRYWKSSTTHQWIFSINNQKILFSYRKADIIVQHFPNFD